MDSQSVAYLYDNSQSFHLIGLGSEACFELGPENRLDELDLFLQNHSGAHLFCCLSYDLKNRIEKLSSKHVDGIEFPEAVVWKPEVVIQFNGQDTQVLYGNLSAEQNVQWEQIQVKLSGKSGKLPSLKFKARTDKQDYLNQVNQIKAHIQQGDVYEVNYCQEYHTLVPEEFDSWELVRALGELTQAPFSAYIRLGKHEVFCGSPERFIQKKDSRLISQPIKGTIARGKNEEEDILLRKQLMNDPKERAENIMITDLVRNDFSRIAAKNSVQVDELCACYSFGTVHQLISTVSCSLRDKITFSEILKATFPMGSMTGAPKISAMKLIEKTEDFSRGIYSGSIGYFDPKGNFDFNVVIRSLVLNRETNYLSCAVGGAITIQSEAEKEYQECQAKVSKIMNLLGGDQ
ncbi:MAG: anthranilate synthase component I family protein [Bacteroidetes bacterium]|nr:MAG: anthranilate synthase component I family protein [Bacteroidota bacterium]